MGQRPASSRLKGDTGPQKGGDGIQAREGEQQNEGPVPPNRTYGCTYNSAPIANPNSASNEELGEHTR